MLAKASRADFGAIGAVISMLSESASRRALDKRHVNEIDQQGITIFDSKALDDCEMVFDEFAIFHVICPPKPAANRIVRIIGIKTDHRDCSVIF
ncbi:hypothetical protein [Rhizobium ruizarguesonis]|uniref:hypothetical protein n=1 Tax=Rhizobium ruizarguesonis TaxID=2081791 RepID=UPI0010311134|nr:hypothetical protein [Rhizobium ruizarguesonis]TBD71737.1 hypothetical protein ELH11_38055 [Rhizobium ruizarguesonis]TBD94894.1 hypothetical protein ELH09_38045 [Rhizobium ruizarguesonis]TBE14552.1 hypothetical protein ELH07_38265 [Rhizobium ruizarguesonis]TBE14736.1 hypothetical protein ELH08_38635 [Rhizobium ruizarguesonis]WSH04951.1 hypothetical protein U8P71_34565 [Rhizobium ruizarguesonis]